MADHHEIALRHALAAHHATERSRVHLAAGQPALAGLDAMDAASHGLLCVLYGGCPRADVDAALALDAFERGDLADLGDA